MLILVVVAEDTGAYVLLNLTLLLLAMGSKFVPLMVTAVPECPAVGVKPVMVGALLSPTVKDVLLVVEPDGDVTTMGPVVAPVGTLVTILVLVEDVTVAETPLKVSVF